MRPGLFLTFEGGEGSGKSTQARLLAERLKAGGAAVRLTREPGGTPTAERIRALLLSDDPALTMEPLSQALLHGAARVEHLEDVIRPALARGEVIICDRFADSTLVYQGSGLGVPDDVLRTLQHCVVGDTGPDLTVILDVSPAVAARRLVGRGGPADRYGQMDEAFHGRVREGFRDLAARAPERCVLIDGDADQETVQAKVFELVRARFPAVVPAGARPQ